MAKLIGFIAGCLITTLGVMFFNPPQAPGVVADEQTRLKSKAVNENGIQAVKVKQGTVAANNKMQQGSDMLEAEAHNSNTSVHQPVAAFNAGSMPGAETQRQPILRQPFKSRYSADGFARRLSRETGVEISVIKRAPDRYEVGFSYTSEQDLQQKKTLIESKTGLKI